MGVKLHEKQNDGTICVNDMKDGQIAVVWVWGLAGARSEYCGRLVQRNDCRLVSLGMPNENTWPDIFNNRREDCRVRLLKPGELLEITGN